VSLQYNTIGAAVHGCCLRILHYTDQK